MKINQLKAISIAYRLRQLGYAVICPHAEAMFSETSLDYKGWIKHGLKLLSVCDICFVYDGWETSNGTKIEIDFCKENSIQLKFSWIGDDGKFNICDFD